MASLGVPRVRERINQACAVSGRDPSSVTLVVVSKNRRDTEVMEAYEEGERVFAENREQGLKLRISGNMPSDIVWQFVGPLQSRKVPFVATHVELLQSLDRISLAQKWATRSDAPVLIQFNLASEPQKSGFNPSDASRIVDEVLALGVSVRGVMAIPPVADGPEDSRPWFRMLREIFDDVRAGNDDIDTCSMGMSNDLEVAIQEGATMVRVGRAIFV